MRKLIIVSCVLLLLFLLWLLFVSDIFQTSKIVINGQVITNPILNTFGGAVGLIISVVVIFCVSILLVLIFSGIGLIILSVILIVMSLILLVLFPFILPILLPLFLIWLILMLSKNRNQSLKSENTINNFE